MDYYELHIETMERCILCWQKDSCVYGLFLAMVERLGKAHSEEEWKNLLELYVVEMEVSVMQRSIQGAIR